MIMILLIIYLICYFGVMYTNYKGINEIRNLLIIGMVIALVTWIVLMFMNNGYYEKALNVYKKYQEIEGNIKTYETLYNNKLDDMRKVKRELENTRQQVMNLKLEDAWEYIYEENQDAAGKPNGYSPTYKIDLGNPDKLTYDDAVLANDKAMMDNYKDVVLKFLNTIKSDKDSILYTRVVNKFQKLDQSLKKDKDGKTKYDITNILRNANKPSAKPYVPQNCNVNITQETLEKILVEIRKLTLKRNSDVSLYKEAYNYVIDAFLKRAKSTNNIFKRIVDRSYAGWLYDLQVGKQYLKLASDKIDEYKYDQYKYLKSLGENIKSGLGPVSDEVMKKSVFTS